MSGVAQFVSAYTTGCSWVSFYGASLVNAEEKYKNIYTIHSSGSGCGYSEWGGIYGDAVYETSIADTSVMSGFCAWDGDISSSVDSTWPFFYRGGCGIFEFSGDGGRGSYTSGNSSVTSHITFRAVLITQ